MLVLERPELQELETDIDKKYCHIICCHPVLSLCGAYKPVLCGTYLIDEDGVMREICPVCKLETCPECIDLLYDCPSCGGVKI